MNLILKCRDFLKRKIIDKYKIGLYYIKKGDERVCIIRFRLLVVLEVEKAHCVKFYQKN